MEKNPVFGGKNMEFGLGFAFFADQLDKHLGFKHLSASGKRASIIQERT